MLLQIINELPAAENLSTGADALQKLITKFGFRLLIDFVSVFILIRLVYYPVYKRTARFFTFFLFNEVIF